MHSDGTKGVIQYRGYNINDIIASGKSYYDTTHLLVWGSWPTEDEKLNLDKQLKAYPLPDTVLKIIHAFP